MRWARIEEDLRWGASSCANIESHCLAAGTRGRQRALKPVRPRGNRRKCGPPLVRKNRSYDGSRTDSREILLNARQRAGEPLFQDLTKVLCSTRERKLLCP